MNKELYRTVYPEGMKQCPFCAGTKICVDIVEPHTHSKKLKDMGLADCKGNMFISCDNCGCSIAINDSADITLAVNKWNTRKEGK